METQRDYEDLLKLLNKHKVKYCIIGSYAVAFYARPRYTKDIDILVETNIENAKKILKALNEFGFKNVGLSVKDFNKKGRIVQLGYEPVRIDILTSIKGVSFKKIWDNKKKGTYGKQKINFVALKDLIKIKNISKRKQDIADLDILKRLK